MSEPSPSEKAGPDNTESSRTDSTEAESTKSESTKEETKRKFREALEAKHGRHGEDHIQVDPQQPDAHGPVSEKRTFRRKTG